jgi:chromosome segregation protein
MLLHKLEIKGFKSFGDKVSFVFDEGVTAVVGPNGSGKSNVVDAIRWVLGEQSTKALRSDKMDNIIFNGTKKRKPLQMAEVSLSFKNTKNLLPTEYTEVTITRRFYRSGEGEYLLNGIVCRLKDINELFMDTGIGSDSYAIIELKMIDNILNDNENARREMFEEAAGVAKFKKRKKETLKKLSETDADLERVEDLLAEIEKNMRSLERQAKQAEKYIKTKELYRKASISLARRSVQEQFDKLQHFQERIQQESDTKEALVAQMADFEAKLEREKFELLEKEKLLSTRQKALNEQVHKIRQYESDKKIRSERLKMLNDRCSNLRKQVEDDTQNIQKSKFSLEALHKERETLEKRLQEATYSLEQLKKDYEEQKLKTDTTKLEYSTLQDQMKAKQNLVYQLKKTLEISEVQRSGLKQELERESHDTETRSASLVEFDQRTQTLQNQLGEKKNRLEALQDRQQQIESQGEMLFSSVKSLKDELSKASRLMDAKQNEFNLTKSMLDNLEGYPDALKFLKKNTEFGKKAPLLSDIITTEDKYRIAIENFLEPFLNYFILENKETALEAVEVLSSSGKGKANFFVMDSLRHYRPKGYKQFEGAVSAIEIVECEEKYKTLAAFLLEDVYIVTNKLEEFPNDEHSIFVTQNGKIIKKKHTISGGSIGLFEGKKIGRALNLEKLTKDIKELEKRIIELERLIYQHERDMQLLKEDNPKNEIVLLQNQLRLLNEEFITVKTKKEQFVSMLQASADKKELIQEKISQVEESMRQVRPQVSDAEQTLLTLEERAMILRDELDYHNEQLNHKSTAFNQQNIVYHQINNQLSGTEKEIEYKESTYTKSVARLQSNQEELKRSEEEIRQVENAVDSGENELIALYEEKQSIETGVNEAEKDYYATRGNISELEKSIRETQRKRESQDSLLMQLKEKSNETRMELSSVKERVRVEFEVDLEAIAQEPDEHADFATDYLRDEVTGLKKKMEGMGAINYMAIEAYKEIEERYNFIIAQKNDLLNAKNSLMQTIGEIDEVAKKNFSEAFEKIRENFTKVFKTLFTEEDTCDLILKNPEDPLESDIDIFARPKGKRPLTINQLSGGEKTLTATALLFSIYLIKPAPFCIFDEVDAPLDDANIDKFNNIIRTFSKNSQFIVVTHNKRTMAATDIIYGVTMIEQGITTVVPVDLRDVEKQG